MIFISYSWADAQVAHALHRMLSHSGRETWIDIERLDLRIDLRRQLERAVNQAHVVLLIDSLDAYASEWTEFEVECAEKARIPVTRIHPIFVNLWCADSGEVKEQSSKYGRSLVSGLAFQPDERDCVSLNYSQCECLFPELGLTVMPFTGCDEGIPSLIEEASHDT